MDMKKFFRLLAGSILFPIFLCLYFWDRVLTIPLVWLKTESLLDWFRDTDKMTNSVIRGGVAGIIVVLIWIIL